MASPEFLRAKAAELRALAAQARVPEVIVQLELWAQEFEEEVQRAELSSASPKVVVLGRKAEIR